MNPSRRFILNLVVTAAGVAALSLCLSLWRSMTRIESRYLGASGAGERVGASPPRSAGRTQLFSRLPAGVGPFAPPVARKQPVYALEDRYRLAGVFSIVDVTGATSLQAIVHTLATGEQHVFSAGEPLNEGVVIQRVLPDSIVCKTPWGASRLVLRNGFSGNASKDLLSATHATNGTVRVTDAAMPFGGKRVSERRWHFERDGLMRYYHELRNEPARLLDLFDSLKPVRTADHAITGYRLGIEGESGFFEAVGLHEGDIIRSVNSLKMTNRKRAEAFVRAFARDNLSTVVLHVERDGKTEKQLYVIDPTELEKRLE